MALDFSNIKEFHIGNTEVVKIEDSNSVVLWEKTSQIKDWFYVERGNGLSDATTVSVKFQRYGTINTGSGVPTVIEYSNNGKDWSRVTINAWITIPLGGKTYFRANGTRWTDARSNGYYNIIGSNPFNIGGNLLSMLYGDSFTGEETTLPSGSTLTFANLFYGSGYLKSGTDLRIPITAINEKCFYRTFYNCTKLTKLPINLFKTIKTYGVNAFEECFKSCTSFNTALNFAANGTIPAYCMKNTFNGCTSLTRTGELPGGTLSTQSFYQTFYNCNKLVYIDAHKIYSISASSCTTYWVSGVGSGGQMLVYYRGASYVGWTTGTSGIPSGWSAVPVG